MIAGADYKRAAGVIEARSDGSEEGGGVSPRVLRAAWALARLPAIPTPDFSTRLAHALLELCEPPTVVTLQVGGLDGPADWHCHGSGIATNEADRVIRCARPVALPWHELAAASGSRACLVRHPMPGEACLREVEHLHEAVGSRVGLSALATTGGPDASVLTVQFGSFVEAPTTPSAALVAAMLPWAIVIARAALGDQAGSGSWLTARESEVLGRLVAGRSVAKIAQELERSPYTVHDHVKSLHRKLGVRTRAALVAKATIGVPPP